MPGSWLQPFWKHSGAKAEVAGGLHCDVEVACRTLLDWEMKLGGLQDCKFWQHLLLQLSDS
jgi:hypothetical protein